MAPVHRTEHHTAQVVIELTKSEIIAMVKQYYHETVPDTADICDTGTENLKDLTNSAVLLCFSWTESK
jgi:hypothetical protein